MAREKSNIVQFRRVVAVLRNAAPEEYDVFVRYFDTYTIDALHAVTEADSVEILTMKGRAQQCLALLRIYQEADSSQRTPTSP